jgi:hypothetical protein
VSLLGLVPDFTVIKLLGLVGFGYAMLVIAARRGSQPVFGSMQARLFGLVLSCSSRS